MSEWQLTEWRVSFFLWHFGAEEWRSSAEEWRFSREKRHFRFEFSREFNAKVALFLLYVSDTFAKVALCRENSVLITIIKRLKLMKKTGTIVTMRYRYRKEWREKGVTLDDVVEQIRQCKE